MPAADNHEYVCICIHMHIYYTYSNLMQHLQMLTGCSVPCLPTLCMASHCKRVLVKAKQAWSCQAGNLGINRSLVNVLYLLPCIGCIVHACCELAECKAICEVPPSCGGSHPMFSTADGRGLKGVAFADALDARSTCPTLPEYGSPEYDSRPLDRLHVSTPALLSATTSTIQDVLQGPAELAPAAAEVRQHAYSSYSLFPLSVI